MRCSVQALAALLVLAALPPVAGSSGYAALEAAGLAHNFSSEYAVAAYMRTATTRAHPRTAQVLLKVLTIDRLSTIDQTLALNYRLISLWNQTQMACGPAESQSATWDPYDCWEGRGNGPCYVHPPLLSPRAWAEHWSATAQFPVLPFRCGGGWGSRAGPELSVYDRATELDPTTNPPEVASFRRQFWTPSFTMQARVRITPTGRPMAAAVLPFGGSAESGHVTMLGLEDKHAEVKVQLDLTRYPFDSSVLELALLPQIPEVETSYVALPYLDDVNVKLFGSAVQAGEVEQDGRTGRTESSTPVGGTVSGMTVDSVETTTFRSKQELLDRESPEGYIGLKLTITVHRDGAAIWWDYGMTTIVIHLCAWCLQFSDHRVKPALAGTVVAQVVLMIITNHLSIALSQKLPPGEDSPLPHCSPASSDGVGAETDWVFLKTFISTSVYLQGLHLVSHYLRMHLAMDKTHVSERWLWIVRRSSQVGGLALFAGIEIIVALAYLHVVMSAATIATLIFTCVLLSVTCAAYFTWMVKTHQRWRWGEHGEDDGRANRENGDIGEGDSDGFVVFNTNRSVNESKRQVELEMNPAVGPVRASGISKRTAMAAIAKHATDNRSQESGDDESGIEAVVAF